MPRTSYQIGHFLERWTAFLFFFKGYFLIARNFSIGRGTGAGEVDLIFKKGKTLIFVEVKKRPTRTQARYAIDGKNQTRVVRASAVFLARRPQYQNYAIRYDAVIYGNSLWPTHIQNAWQVL